MSSGDIDVSLARNDGKVLYVRWSPFDNIAHIVSAATIAEADAADEQPVLVDFGDLRRSGDLDTLGERLEQHGYGTLADYVAAIERVNKAFGADVKGAYDNLNKVLVESAFAIPTNTYDIGLIVAAKNVGGITREIDNMLVVRTVGLR